ncbi:site-specific integrase [Pseudomaricurvus alkylphenolicus]|uniref:tyrosine-type recombinase/integrase n=1 Tax=Pseudomaricurvus alkylphenolicus TaxID=1306991 RepID=UPI00141DD403|nr:site-specific integrase [Pseudomaricurvus alkylphenolicus]NIB45057.1 site-specific integrase [Pseudomaricurvus alkylphenolicus]
MNPKRKPPVPIIDNLGQIGNPYRQKQFSVDQYLDQPVDGIEVDLEHALKFLYSYNGSTATFNSYRRELERLLQWAWRIEQISVLTLRREHIEDFVRFCLKPPTAWIGTKNVSRFKNQQGERVANEKWRPFVVSVPKSEFRDGQTAEAKQFSLSQSAIKAIFTILSSFYDYLLQEHLVDVNPVALIRQKNKFVRRDQTKAVVRRISNIQWDYVLETAEIMAAEHSVEHERTLFIMNCLYAMYLRISELVADERSEPVMGDFRKDQDGNWWFHVTGKGNKDRIITVCNEMLTALKRYRKFLGLSSLPGASEKTPLIAKTKGQGPVTSTRHIRRIVQLCFDTAFQRMADDGLQEDAEDLRLATVHWLRHTGISEDVKFRPREHVRDDAGHASMATTDRYIESDMRERHESGRQKRLKEIY